MVCDPSKFAMDYHNIGFQECIAEVNKQLSVEGLDLQDPLRMRLMSHLQSVSAQRGWYPSAGPPPPPHPPNASQLYQSCSPLSPHVPRHPPPPPPSLPLPSAPLSSYHNASLNSSSASLEMSNSTSLNSSGSHSHSLNSSYESSTNSGSGGGNCEPTPTSSTQSSTSANTIRPLTTISSTADGYHYLHQNVHQNSSLDLYHHSQHLHQQHPYGQAPTDPSVSKQPYRPWGTECAY